MDSISPQCPPRPSRPDRLLTVVLMRYSGVATGHGFETLKLILSAGTKKREPSRLLLLSTGLKSPLAGGQLPGGRQYIGEIRAQAIAFFGKLVPELRRG